MGGGGGGPRASETNKMSKKGETDTRGHRVNGKGKEGSPYKKRWLSERRHKWDTE